MYIKLLRYSSYHFNFLENIELFLMVYVLSLVLLLFTNTLFATPITYQVEITGVDDTLKKTLYAVSETQRLQDKKVVSILLLRRRANKDMTRIKKYLHTLAYYDAQVAYRIKEEPSLKRVQFIITLGKPYILTQITVKAYKDEKKQALVENASFLPKLKKQPFVATSSDILELEKKIVKKAKQQGYALAKLGKRRILVDYVKKQVKVIFLLYVHPLCYLDIPEITGYQEVELDFIKKQIEWTKGDRFDQQVLNQTRNNLLNTHLFSTVRIILGKKLNEHQRLPVTIEVKERQFRSIGVGAKLNTYRGLELSFSWEHRNYFHAGEKLSATVDASQDKSSLDITLRKPDFWERKQTLILSNVLLQEDIDAYESLSLDMQVILERPLDSLQTIQYGLRFRPVKVTEKSTGIEESFGLFSVPLNYLLDYSDNYFDPTKGGRLNVHFQPFVDVLGSGVSFFKSQLTYSHYLQLFSHPRLIWANRSSIGGIFGAPLDDIPADERFYAGGGGSIRGYGYKLVSPLDQDNNPLGGRSLFEFATELRYRAWDNIGVVGFIDSGAAFIDSYPNFDTLQLGAGMGMRYVTAIGPLRFDIAIPLNKRDIDDSYQFYISIGQAF